MIKIFRNKRKKMLYTKKFKDYLLYSIGEIILVVVGILIALYISNWNNDEIKKEIGISSLKRIKRDLNTEKYVLEDFKKRYSYTRKYLVDILYNGHKDNLDSIKFHFGPFVHYKMNTEYMNLKSSGQLNLITNNKLRNNLVNFYEVYYSIYNELEEEHKFFINSKVVDYFFNKFPSDTSNFVDSSAVISRLEDNDFKSIINAQITSLEYITNNMYIDKISNLIKAVDVELKKK
ncbi:MAG: DUF6090 family protein [Polaribacter sp.]|nr:DUF6090 family protein [Polaribacter sp.]